MNKKLTIFTPTYNRAHTLSRTYKSIIMQEKKFLSSIEWLIVDDGSSDYTEKLVEGWKNNFLPFTLRYIKQSNGGKHTAHNRAILEATGELFFTVDSDDWLSKDCLKKIFECAQYIYHRKDLCGIIALKSLSNKKIIDKPFPNNYTYSSLYELSLKGYGGERSMVFKTEILKQYPYPIIQGERFIGESVVYDRLDKNYKYFISNNVLTDCEYQEDGLTSNFFKLMMNNAIGYKIYFSQRIDIAHNIKWRFHYAIRYWAFKLMKSDSKYDYNGPHKISI